MKKILEEIVATFRNEENGWNFPDYAWNFNGKTKACSAYMAIEVEGEIGQEMEADKKHPNFKNVWPTAFRGEVTIPETIPANVDGNENMLRPVDMGPFKIARKFLFIMKKLPGAKVIKWNTSVTPLLVEFVGGSAVFMPVLK